MFVVSVMLLRENKLVFSPERGAKRRVQGKMKFICGNDAACLGACCEGPEGQTFSYGCCGQKFWFVYPPPTLVFYHQVSRNSLY